MKKILVVLLVLAVATGVFAQEGEWSFNGTAEVGFVVDLDPGPNGNVGAPTPADKPLATSNGTQWNRTFDGWDGIKGQLGINYNRDAFGAGLQITDITEDKALVGSLSYGGENFNFSAKSDLANLIKGDSSFNQLWGNYTFLNGLVFLEASYVRGWAGDQFWASDTTGAFRNYNGRSSEIIAGPFVDKHTFTMTDGGDGPWSSSYIAADVRLQGLNFGVMIRDIFQKDRDYSIDRNGDVTYGTSGKKADAPNGPFDVTFPMTFVDDVLKEMIFGIKFEMNPIEVAAQFLVKDYGVYLGGKWFVGPVTVGLSYMGILGETRLVNIKTDKGYVFKEAKQTDEDLITEYLLLAAGVDPADLLDDDGNPLINSGEDKLTYGSKITKKTYKATENINMKVGASVNYDAEGFGASIKGFLAMKGNKSKEFTGWAGEKNNGSIVGGYISQIGVEPGFYYNVIPTHLRFTLDAGFYFFSFFAKDKEVTDGVNTVQFALQPTLFWNFLGTGAGGYGGTGIFIRYRLVGGDSTKYAQLPVNNKFDVNFKWSF